MKLNINIYTKSQSFIIILAIVICHNYDFLSHGFNFIRLYLNVQIVLS